MSNVKETAENTNSEWLKLSFCQCNAEGERDDVYRAWLGDKKLGSQLMLCAYYDIQVGKDQVFEGLKLEKDYGDKHFHGNDSSKLQTEAVFARLDNATLMLNEGTLLRPRPDIHKKECRAAEIKKITEGLSDATKQKEALTQKEQELQLRLCQLNLGA